MGLREGLAYGVRIRLPHALVMTALFRSGPLHKLISGMLGLTWEHARRLGAFVAVYKGLLSLLRFARGRVGVTPTGQVASPMDPAVAGGLAAYLVWYGGAYNGVAYQIALYLLGRVVVAAARYAAASGVPPFCHITFKGSGYPLLVVGAWAAVMWLYETPAAATHLQRSLAVSMDTLYRHSSRVAVGGASTTPSATLTRGSTLDWEGLAPTSALAAVLAWAAWRGTTGQDAVPGLLRMLGLGDVCIGGGGGGAPVATPPRPQGAPGTPASRPTATPLTAVRGSATPASRSTAADPLRTPGSAVKR